MKDIKGIIHVGTKRKSVKELAIKLGKKNIYLNNYDNA